MKITEQIDGLQKVNTTETVKAGQILECANGMKIMTEARGDLLESNRGRVFRAATTKGYFGGVSFKTNAAGERVIAGSSADDTRSDGDVLVHNAASTDRRRKENKVPAQIG